MMSEAPPPLPPPRKLLPLLAGMLVANLFGAALSLGVVGLLDIYKSSGERALAVPSLFLIPLAAGLTAAWFWRKLDHTIGDCLLHALSTTAISVAGASLFMGEGAVCLIIASPALYIMILSGALLGRVWFRPDWTKLQLAVFPLIALITAGEAFTRSDEMAVVSDEILIRARPEKVWPHVLAFPEIPDRAGYWLFRAGLPHPTSTTNGGNFIGADRQCNFSDGIVIREKVAEFEPNKKLTFDITEQPTHPEAYGHITLHRGQFILRDNRDGTTTLIGSSWYSLHVRPLWYFDLWTRHMTRAVHLHVMRHIRHLAEA